MPEFLKTVNHVIAAGCQRCERQCMRFRTPTICVDLGLSVAKPRPPPQSCGQGVVILSTIFVLFAFLCGKNLSSEPPRLQFDFNGLWFHGPFTVVRY